MYIPAHFKMNDTAEIRTFVMAHPFGALLTNGKQVPQVTHLPMQLLTDDAGNDSINLHLSKANPHAKGLENRENAVAVFLEQTVTFRLAGMPQKIMFQPGITLQCMQLELCGKLKTRKN